MTGSLTTALKEITISNEQMCKEIDVLKTDNTQLRINNDALKNENKQLATLLDKMADNNENQMQQINLLCSDVQQLNVSQCVCVGISYT